MATGTSKNFTIASGGWSAYTATVNDDPSTSESGVIVNGLRQWQWDISGPSFYSTGTSHMIYFVPGTTTTNGEWYASGSTPVLGTRSGTNGTTITLGTVAVFDETAAFYGSVPSTGGGTGTESVPLQTAETAGHFGFNSNGDLTAMIPASTPSGNFWIVEGSVPRNGFSHTELTVTFEVATGWSATNTSTWYLQDGNGTVLDTYGKKKVFCNFW